MAFIPRDEKADFGFQCNQSADGRLWAGKGYRQTLDRQVGARTAADISRALAATRGDRCGRFWINIADRKITMVVGESADNEYETVDF